MKYFLTIDAGTTVIKTVIFNSNFKQLKVCNLKNPVIILFIFIGKYFVSGLTEGAIK